MKKLVILRGVSGSGKSTYAKKLMEGALGDGYLSVAICSADNYWIRPDGVYDFNPRMLKNAHAWCRQQVEECMTEDLTAETGEWQCDLIILDNTNTRKWEYQPYIDLAKEHGYEVEEKIIGNFSEDAAKIYAERNQHGVPLSKVVDMMKRFEK